MAVAAFLAGRPGWFSDLRHRTAIPIREHTALAIWVGAHRDLVRFGGVVAAVIGLYVGDLSVWSIVWIALLLVAFQIGIGFVAAPRSNQSQPRAEGSLRG